VFETPALAVIIAGVRQEWVQTILGIGPVAKYIKQNYTHKFYNFLGSFLFNHQIMYSCVHFAILTLKLPNGIALSGCLYLMSYYWTAGDVIWRNGNFLKVALVDLGRSGSGRKPDSILCVSFLEAPSWKQFDMASYTFGVRYQFILPLTSK
jgi:hypothetical protein